MAVQSAFGQSGINDKTTQDILVGQSDLRIENLKKQAVELFEAYDKVNVEKFVELTDPRSFEEYGSRENFAKMIGHFLRLLSEIDGVQPSSVENPGELLEIDNRLFCVVGYKLERWNNFEKSKVVKTSSIVGISSDNGKTWKFVNGLAFNKLYPEIAGRIQLPNEKRFLNGNEQ